MDHVQRRFAFALGVSAAVHALLLTALWSFAAGIVPRPVPRTGERVVQAFLAWEKAPAPEKAAPLPGGKRMAIGRTAPAKEGIRDAAERERGDLRPEVRPYAEGRAKRGGRADNPDPSFPAGRQPAAVGPDAGENGRGWPTTPFFSPEMEEQSGGGGAKTAAASRTAGMHSGGEGAAAASRRAGTGETFRGVGAPGPPGGVDADRDPRYGDNARPAYPPLAKIRGYEGLVVLLVEVLDDGRVGQVGIKRSAGHQILDRAAMEAVRTWRFEPGRREGRAAAMTVELPVRFVLNEN